MMRWAVLLLLSIFPLKINAAPNVIIILADDMGYSDLGCYGGEMETPALDRLATEGVRLSSFHNGGMCVVSRASLLTGKWWPQALPQFSQSPLLSEKFHDIGYRTALVGKWHLPGNPMDRGFDHFFGFLEGFADLFTGAPSYRLDREAFVDFPKGYYSTDAFTDRAIDFIRATDPAKPQQPFFLYLSFQAPHNPLQVPKEDIAKYRGRYAKGWQVVREARFERQKALGLFAASATLPDYPKNLPAWDSLTPAQRDLEDLRMAVYAAMIDRMDRGIGRLMSALKECKQEENTLILMMSDNGADSFSVVDQAMLKKNLLPGDAGSNWQLGTGWAYASVTPWRLYKISQHAGGVRSGAIVWWSGKITKPGRIESTPLHLVDVQPTLLELTGQSASTVATAGESFAPLLLGESWHRKRPLFFQYMDNRSIRTDKWTLAEVDGAGWELYDHLTDPFESIDVSKQHQELVADLERQWLSWWREQSGKLTYIPETTKGSPHYKPQGDRGSGDMYIPSAMPKLK
jgi:arylsulfatase A-like enzyme